MLKLPVIKENIDNLSKIEYIVKRYTVRITHRALKNLDKMPKSQQENGVNMYHCHLSRKWVACWKNESGTLTIEVYYVGSRQSAPYARH